MEKMEMVKIIRMLMKENTVVIIEMVMENKMETMKGEMMMVLMEDEVMEVMQVMIIQMGMEERTEVMEVMTIERRNL